MKSQLLFIILCLALQGMAQNANTIGASQGKTGCGAINPIPERKIKFLNFNRKKYTGKGLDTLVCQPVN